MLDRKSADLTLLTQEEYVGSGIFSNKGLLEVLRKYGLAAGITDLVVLTGGNVVFDYNLYNEVLKNKTSTFLTRDFDNLGTVKCIKGFFGVEYGERYDKFYTIRPVLDLSDSLFSQITSKKRKTPGYNSVYEVELGEYPQYVASVDMQKELNLEYVVDNGKMMDIFEIKETGRDYTFAKKGSLNLFSPMEYKEYEYKGKKYIRMLANSDFKNYYEFELSNGVKCENDNYVWVEVSPVIWLIDDKTKKLVSKRGLLSGISFSGLSEKMYIDFNKTQIKKYLDEYMFHDLFQSVNFVKANDKGENIQNIDNNLTATGKVHTLNDRSKRVNDIVFEIYNLLDYYYGEEDFKEKISSLNEEYNSNIKNIGNGNSGILTLTPHNVDKGYLYDKLVSDLEDILNKLKENREKYKEYYIMLDLVRDCINLLNDNQEEKDYVNDITNDIKVIKEIVLPYLDNEDNGKKLLNIFLEEEENIISYLSGNDDSSIKECKTYEDFKVRIRRKLHPFLVSINNDVRNKDLVNEIKDGYAKLYAGVFESEKKDYVNDFLKEIDELINKIKDKGNESEITRLEEILEDKITFDDNNLIDSVKKIRELYIKLYGIMIDINERERIKEELEDYKVELNNNYISSANNIR